VRQTQDIQEMNPEASVLLLFTSFRSERSNAAKYVTEVNMTSVSPNSQIIQERITQAPV